MEQRRYTPRADYIIHHSQSIVANMSFILLKLPLPSQGPLCALTNTSQHTQTYCILSLYCCVQLVESITGLLGCSARGEELVSRSTVQYWWSCVSVRQWKQSLPDAQWSVEGSIDVERFISSGFYWRNTHWCVRAAGVGALTQRRYQTIRLRKNGIMHTFACTHSLNVHTLTQLRESGEMKGQCCVSYGAVLE